MPNKEELRQILIANLDETMARVNASLRGEGIEQLEEVMTRLGRGHQLPHWYESLKSTGTLPNLDGKTIGSVLEMVLVAVLETYTFANEDNPPLSVNPARGVDIPALDLGVKSPSTNYSTSEPFFSAYERLLGNEYDALIMLTDYQEAKSNPPLKIQVQQWRYLKKSEIADLGLCSIALDARNILLESNEAWLKKVFRFLAYVNQSDWRAKQLTRMLKHLSSPEDIETLIQQAEADFEAQNRKRERETKELLPEDDLIAIQKIRDISPITLGVIDAADDWVNETQKDAGRYPNDNEWNRLLTSPLDGRIGMSFALQWRYNFARVFGAE